MMPDVDKKIDLIRDGIAAVPDSTQEFNYYRFENDH